MNARITDKNKSGIYCIINTINGKTYVGKSIDIYVRIRSHINMCERKDKDENRHLINAYHLYSKEAFEYIVLEYTDKLKERELYWIEKTNNCDSHRGYNMRLDTRGGMKVSQQTRELMSKNRKQYYKNHPERKLAISKASSLYFSDLENREKMSKSVKKAKQSTHKFFQFTREGEFIKEFDTLDEILLSYPNYKWQNIYAACNGNKPTYMNCIWRRVPKNEDIVKYTLKGV